MSTIEKIEKDMKQLSDIYKTYNKTEGAMKEMWKKKWYDLVKSIARKISELN